jgi:hypothetical protein
MMFATLLYQDLIVLERRFCYLRELKNIRWSVLRVYNRFHNVLFKSPSVGS